MEKKIKLIYEDDPKTCLVRFTNGESEKMPKSAAVKLSKQNKIPIGKSKTIPPKTCNVYW